MYVLIQPLAATQNKPVIIIIMIMNKN